MPKKNVVEVKEIFAVMDMDAREIVNCSFGVQKRLNPFFMSQGAATSGLRRCREEGDTRDLHVVSFPIDVNMVTVIK